MKDKCCRKCGTQIEDTQTMIPCEDCSCHKEWKAMCPKAGSPHYGCGICHPMNFSHPTTNEIKERLIEQFGLLPLSSRQYHIPWLTNALNEVEFEASVRGWNKHRAAIADTIKEYGDEPTKCLEILKHLTKEGESTSPTPKQEE